jgi:hypothetical protein
MSDTSTKRYIVVELLLYPRCCCIFGYFLIGRNFLNSERSFKKLINITGLRCLEIPVSFRLKIGKPRVETRFPIRVGYGSRKSRFSAERVRRPAARFQEFTIARRKPPGGMAC